MSKSKSRGALTGPRTITKMTGMYDNIYTAEWPGASGWKPQGTRTIFSEFYIDLSSNTLDDLTLVPRGGFLQDPGMYQCSNPSPFVIVDIISQEKLDLNSVAFDLDFQAVPGMPETDTEPTQIIFGNLRVMNSNTAIPGAGTNLLFLTSRASQFGSGEPTAVDKLWCYRIIHWLAGAALAPGQTLSIPASRFVLPCTIIHEKDLSYIMRLKRSYELA